MERVFIGLLCGAVPNDVAAVACAVIDLSIMHHLALTQRKPCKYPLMMYIIIHVRHSCQGTTLFSLDYVFIFTYDLPLISFPGICSTESQFLDQVWQPALYY